jgi:hypothetical protein
MKFDSFISSPLTADAAFKRWYRWSFVLTLITLGVIVTVHLRAKNNYNACAHTCALCEKIATGSTVKPKTTGSLSHEYTTINEQATAVRNHITNKAALATLAHDLLKATHTPVTLQSVNITARECTAIFHCPPTFALQKLTQKLAADHPHVHFNLTRLEQREDALLATVSATLTAPTTETK